MDIFHSSEKKSASPRLLNQTSFYIQLANLIERAVVKERPVLVSLMTINPANKDHTDHYQNNIHSTVTRIGNLLIAAFDGHGLVGYADNSTEFSLAMMAGESSFLQALVEQIECIADSMNAYLPCEFRFHLVVSSIIKIPDSMTFADNLIAAARASGHAELGPSMRRNRCFNHYLHQSQRAAL